MKRLRVIAMEAEREDLLKDLQRLGCVEISEPDDKLGDPAWAALLRREESALPRCRGALAEADAALSAARRYAGKEKLLQLRPGVREEDFLSDESLRPAEESQKINDRLRELAALLSEEGRLNARRAALLPWADLDAPLHSPGTAHTLARLLVFPASTDLNAVNGALDADGAAAEVFRVSADKQQLYAYLLCHRAEEERVQEALRPFSFSVVSFPEADGTAQRNVASLDLSLGANRAQQEEVNRALAESGASRGALRLYVDRLTTEADRAANTARLLTDDTIVFFEGWAEAERMDEVARVLDGHGCAWEAEDPAPEEYEHVPIRLKNNAFTRPLNMVTEMHSLPMYGSLDPNPLMAVFFILFYGIMLADMGYGLLMMLTSVIVMKKANPNGPSLRYMIPLMGLCGASTFLMGALTGSFFGDFLPQLVHFFDPNSTFDLPRLFSPLDDALAVLVGSLCLGVLQIFTGMGISAYKKCRRGEALSALCDEGAWFLVFALGAAGILLKNKVFLWAIVALLLLTQGYGKKGVFGKLMGVFGSLYSHVTGYFSDILSYSRLMALMLAGAVISQVFNSLGAITGNIVAFFLISMIGNAINFGLNLLGCFVHDMRLQCLEFFGRFYEEGGRPFRPLSLQTRYVDLVRK